MASGSGRGGSGRRGGKGGPGPRRSGARKAGTRSGTNSGAKPGSKSGKKAGASRSGSGSPQGGGRRPESVRVKTARGRKPSSTAWLERQLNDPYVAEAQRLGYRSRAAFKLIEIDDKHRLLRPGQRVVDLGAAPGGWAQVAVERCRAEEGVGKGGRVVGVDLLAIDPVPGATLIEGDFTEPAIQDELRVLLGGPADIVLSDLSPATTGHKATDHLRIVALVEETVAFAEAVLAPGGAVVAKVFQGGASSEILDHVKRRFTAVKHVKPQASRKESPEVYLVATGFRGAPSDEDTA